MITILALVESSILFTLAAIHFYWAFGGKWGFDKALPTNSEGKRVLNPKWFDSLLVGIGLLVFSFYFLTKTSLVDFEFHKYIKHFLVWIIIIAFSFRAIGDFKYIGFSKRVKDTVFAKHDTRYYSPLCLVLATIAIVLEFLNK